MSHGSHEKENGRSCTNNPDKRRSKRRKSNVPISTTVGDEQDVSSEEDPLGAMRKEVIDIEEKLLSIAKFNGIAVDPLQSISYEWISSLSHEWSKKMLLQMVSLYQLQQKVHKAELEERDATIAQLKFNNKSLNSRLRGKKVELKYEKTRLLSEEEYTLQHFEKSMRSILSRLRADKVVYWNDDLLYNFFIPWTTLWQRKVCHSNMYLLVKAAIASLRSLFTPTRMNDTDCQSNYFATGELIDFYVPSRNKWASLIERAATARIQMFRSHVQAYDGLLRIHMDGSEIGTNRKKCELIVVHGDDFRFVFPCILETGETAHALVACLQRALGNTIFKEKDITLLTDGASNNTGKYGGLYELVKHYSRRKGKTFLLVCVSHALHNMAKSIDECIMDAVAEKMKEKWDETKKRYVGDVSDAIDYHMRTFPSFVRKAKLQSQLQDHLIDYKVEEKKEAEDTERALHLGTLDPLMLVPSDPALVKSFPKKYYPRKILPEGVQKWAPKVPLPPKYKANRFLSEFELANYATLHANALHHGIRQLPEYVEGKLGKKWDEAALTNPIARAVTALKGIGIFPILKKALLDVQRSRFPCAVASRLLWSIEEDVRTVLNKWVEAWGRKILEKLIHPTFNQNADILTILAQLVQTLPSTIRKRWLGHGTGKNRVEGIQFDRQKMWTTMPYALLGLVDIERNKDGSFAKYTTNRKHLEKLLKDEIYQESLNENGIILGKLQSMWDNESGFATLDRLISAAPNVSNPMLKANVVFGFSSPLQGLWESTHVSDRYDQRQRVKWRKSILYNDKGIAITKEQVRGWENHVMEQSVENQEEETKEVEENFVPQKPWWKQQEEDHVQSVIARCLDYYSTQNQHAHVPYGMFPMFVPM